MQHHDKDRTTQTKREARRIGSTVGHIIQADLAVHGRDRRGATQRAMEDDGELRMAQARQPAQLTG
ncbi:MAG: hypothetical protein EOO40_05285 [Deltaproteobacteria bacterium]|nr:MAG: hypothetical protein EOO40_05285 [Deltaproteobacteria bacterium]